MVGFLIKLITTRYKFDFVELIFDSVLYVKYFYNWKQKYSYTLSGFFVFLSRPTITIRYTRKVLSVLEF